MKTRWSVVPLLLIFVLVVSACATPAVQNTAPEATTAPAEQQPAAGSEAPAEAEMAKDIVDTAIAAGSFNTLIAAVQAAGLEDALRGDGPLTVFAPTDEAFAALPEGTVESLLADPEALADILLYHVLAGKVMAESVADGLAADTLQGAPVSFSIVDGKPMINGANIIATDVEASNGVIHVIDAVILPPAEGAMEDDAMAKDIVDTAIAAGSFNTLIAAVQAAGLEDALRGDGPLTVFAPTDEAFAALPEGTVESLLADPEALADILLYHVLAGKVMAESVADGLAADTLQGAPVSFSIVDGKPMINGANIVATDVEASNGVIHVIDAVILPPAEAAMEDDAMAKDIVDTAIARRQLQHPDRRGSGRRSGRCPAGRGPADRLCSHRRSVCGLARRHRRELAGRS